MMFDAFVMVDWSAATVPRTGRDSIWICWSNKGGERLENPPVMDVSVSRHMGLFAVGRLAQRHGARVRLRHGNPQGLAALVWLPDSLIERHAVTAPRSGWGSDDTLPRMPVAVSPGPASPAVAAPVRQSRA